MNAFPIPPMPIPAMIVERLGWVLVHSLWQFALLALLAAVAVRLLRRNSAVARYAVLSMAMLLTVLVPAATWMLLPNPSPINPPEQTVATFEPSVDSENDRWADTDTFYVSPRSATELPGSDFADPLAEADSSWNAPPAKASAHPVSLPSEPSWSDRATLLLQPWLGWIVAGWCVGVVLCSLRPLLGWHTLRRLRRVGVSPVSDDVLATLRRVSQRLGMRRAVRVLHSTLARVPIVVGYVRPTILLPISLVTSIPAAQLEAILAHELAHVRRHDFVVNLLQTLVETVFFYHPAVWWLSSRLRAEREHCCDDLVVAVLDNRVEYGRALLAIEELRGRSSVLALGAADGRLLARVRRIVGLPSDAASSSPWPALGLVMCGIAAVCLVSIFSWHSFAKADPQKTKAEIPGEPLPMEPAADESGNNATTTTIAEDDDMWPPRDAATLLQRLRQRDAEFNNRSIQVERRWIEHVDPREVIAGEQQKLYKQGDPKLTPPPDAEIPDPYDQPHRVRYLMTARYPNLAFDNAADLETMKHPRYAGPVEAKRWPGLPPDALERTLLEVKIWREQERSLNRKSFEWTCGYGFATSIDIVDSMRVENERLVIKGKLTNFLHYWSTQEERDRTGPVQDRFEIELDRDLIVRRAVLEIAAEPARHTSSPLLEITFHKRDSEDIDRFRRFVVETSGVVRHASSSPVATAGRYQVIVQDTKEVERVLIEEDSELLHLSGTLTDSELEKRLAPDREVNPAAESGDLRPAQVESKGTKLEPPPDASLDVVAEIADAEYARPTANDQRATATIPAAAWGEPVDGLRVAIVLRSPPIDKHERLCYDIVAENVSDHDIRFAATLGVDDWHNYCKTKLADADGKQLVQQEGTRLWLRSTLKRLWLKPKERGVISSWTSGLFRQDEAGQPLARPEGYRGPWYFKVQPGRYSVSAAVELGPSMYTGDPVSKKRIVLSPAKGEWSGKLQTGAAPLTIVTASSDGLEFLKPYPKLQRLSLDMTEPQFLEIVKQSGFKVIQTVDGDKGHHYLVLLGDDHTLIVMFDKDAKCSGIQRMRGEADSGTPSERAGRGSPDPALDPTAGLPSSDEETNPTNNANGDLRSNPAATSGDPRRALFGLESNGLRCRLVAVPTAAKDESPDLSKSEDRFVRGEDVTFAVELQNVSDKPVTLIGVRHDAKGQPRFEGKLAPEIFAPHLFELEFTDANGQPAPRTSRDFLPMQLRLNGALTHEVAPSKSLLVLLRPAKFQTPMDHHLPPGSYRAKIRYRGPGDKALAIFQEHFPNEPRAKAWSGEVTSNEVAFTVAKDPSASKPPQLVWGPVKDGLQAAVEFRQPPDAPPTNDPPGTFPTKPEVSTIFHVKNVSDRTIKFVSETWRQGDGITATDEAGATKRLESVWSSGIPIMVRWTLKPGEIAELHATSGIYLLKKPGKYTLQASINFSSLVRNKGEGEDGFPKVDDWQQILVTGDVPVTIRARPPVVVPVSANGEIRGVLLDATTGEPVEGAKVACGALINPSGQRLGSSAVTNDEGRYRLHVPKPGIYNVWLHEYARSQWMIAAADDGLLVEAGKATASQMFLVNARKIIGKLVDSDGKPIEYPVVKCNSPAQPESLGVQYLHKMRTKADGSFWFAVPPGRAYLYVDEESRQTKDSSTGGFRSAHGHVDVPVASDAAPVTLTLETSAKKFGDTEWLKRSTPGTQIVRRDGNQNVTGTVVDESGKPITGAKLHRDDGSIISTNNKGEFHVETPQGTQLTLHALAPGYHVWFGTPTPGDVLKIVLEKKVTATSPPKGLAFLTSYPKLHGLSLDMTEPQFLEIVKQQELKTRETINGEKVTHHITLGDDHTLIVMFDKDAKCSGIQRVRGENDEAVREESIPVLIAPDPIAKYGDQLVVSWVHHGDHRTFSDNGFRVAVLKDGTVIAAGDGNRNRECQIKLTPAQFEQLLQELDEQDQCFELAADSQHFIKPGESYNGWDRTADWYHVRRGEKEMHVGCIYGWESGTADRIPGAVICGKLMARLSRLINVTRAGGWDEIERLLPAANAALKQSFPQLAALTVTDFMTSERFLYPARSIYFRNADSGDDGFGVGLERRDDGEVLPITVWNGKDRRDVEKPPVVRGLDLAQVPFTKEWKDIEKLRVKTDHGYEYKPEYGAYKVEAETWVCHVPKENKFYIEVGNNQRRRKLYGPIAGSPFDLLNPPPVPTTSVEAATTQLQNGLSLADLVRDFNAENQQLGRGLDQPALTEDEIIAYIKRDKWKPEPLPLNDKEIAAFKAVAESRRLPKDSYLQVYTEERADTFVFKQLWQVRLMLPAIGHDGFVGLTIRDTKVAEEKIDPQQVAWGKPDPDGLSLGIYLSPKKDKYQIGERVRLRLFVRNEGQKTVETTWANTSHPMPDAFTVTDETGAKVAVRIGHESWHLPWISGYVSGGIAADGAHAFFVPYEISIGGDGSKNNLIGRVIDARPGQTLNIKIRDSNGNNRTRADNEPLPETGVITLTVANAADSPSRAAKDDSVLRERIGSGLTPGHFGGASLLMRIEPDGSIRYSDTKNLCQMTLIDDDRLQIGFEGGNRIWTDVTLPLEIGAGGQNRSVWSVEMDGHAYQVTAIPFSTRGCFFRLEKRRDGKLIHGSLQFFAVKNRPALAAAGAEQEAPAAPIDYRAWRVDQSGSGVIAGRYTGASQLMQIAADGSVSYTDQPPGICHLAVLEDDRLTATFRDTRGMPAGVTLPLVTTAAQDRASWSAEIDGHTLRVTAIPYSDTVYVFRLEKLLNGKLIEGEQQFYAIDQKLRKATPEERAKAESDSNGQPTGRLN